MGRWYKVASPEITKEMEDWYATRTNNHIKLVQKYCRKIVEYDSNRFGELKDRLKVHDDSKFKEPEKTPYIYITWDYKCKDDGVDFDIDDDMRDRMNDATEHHIRYNSHHPEYHSDQKSTINKGDRDKPPEEMIDATAMPDLDIAEMCADWVSMGIEKGNSAKEWADKNVNIRWKFTGEQESLIYELIEICEGKEK